MLKYIAAFVLGLMIMASQPVQACPSTLDCGEFEPICEVVTSCVTHKVCKWKKVCSKDKDKCCSEDKTMLCHIPPGNPKKARTLCIGNSAVLKHHQNHGDYLGKCNYGCEMRKVCSYKKCCKKTKVCKCPTPPDAGVDEGVRDAGVPDVTPEPDQSVLPDQGVQDLEVPDQGVQDSEAPDQYVPTQDSMVPQDSRVIEKDGNCNCPDGYTPVPDPPIDEEDLEIIGGGGCSMNSNSNSVGLGIIAGLLFFVIGVIRRSKLMMIFACLIMATSAYAYDGDYFVTKGGKTEGHWAPQIGVKMDYKHRPAQIVNKKTGDRVTDVVHHSTELSLDFNLTLWNVLELDLMLPIQLSQGVRGLSYINRSSDEAWVGGLGDMVLTPKLSLFTVGTKNLFHIAALAPIGLPTTTYESLLGSSGPSIAPTLALEFDSRWVDVGFNAGYTFASDNSLVFRSQKVSFDDAVTLSLGIKVPVWEHKIEVIGDSYISMPTTNSMDKEDVPAELLGGFRFYLPHGLHADIGGGAGITKGVGAPEFRLFAGLAWSLQPESKPKVIRETVYVEPSCPDCPKCPEVEHGIVVIPPVFFDFDKDYITATSRPVLIQIADTLRNSKKIKKIVLVVHGHTDSKGSVQYNYDLGFRRAQYVIDMLHRMGVKAQLFINVSHSELAPYTTNKTDDGRAQNRRVEIKVEY